MNPVPSVSVKVINPSKKSDTRLFILRKVELQKLNKRLLLKRVLKWDTFRVISVCGCEMRMTFKKL